MGIIAHGVNCQGVMGSGVAKDLREKYPKIFNSYKERCNFVDRKQSASLLGMVDYVMVSKDPTIYIANCFTQNFYGRNPGRKFADPEAITSCLENILYTNGHGYNYPIYIPKIGCGLGGLDWETEVKPNIEWLANSYPDQTINLCDLG